MGYHVTILRTKGGNSEPISKSEVCEVVSRFPSLFIKGKIIFRNERHFLSIDEENGELWCKNPDEEEMVEMLQLANEMNARVRGDEFETYKSINETYIHPDDKKFVDTNRKQASNIAKQAKRKQLILNGSIYSFFFLLVLIANYCSKGN